MKKWLLLLAVLLLVGYKAVQLQHGKQAGNNNTPPATTAEQVQGQPPEQDAAKNELTVHVTENQIHEGDLLLVNRDIPVPAGEPGSEAVELYRHKELLNGFGLLNNTIRLSPSLAEKFSAMVEAAAKDGVNHFMISSGYRDENQQKELYREKGADYAMPAGYSEHNLGLSLDIGSTLGEMRTAPEGKWLTANGWKYGFILRYPKDKSAITGTLFEPWHFRYVGLPHSAIMAEHHFVLEEYLDYLKQQKTISVTVEGRKYDIFYYPIAGDKTIHVPLTGDYDISGNNTDGIIITVQS
ncbi:D-alanyl-D-alanine carboxypeptidase family protein [Paenibacillus sp. R14(2021)]|uniref:M15 family metallopeptidase n=1 Tax=Paenibacillus sp. R14(2021) TaxID=2859228 RepID=UPI001C614421|nr:M15 family metallopeptidase [Paenibacillus sp. R14(2021)]